jgi:hypothetical protein
MFVDITGKNNLEEMGLDTPHFFKVILAHDLHKHKFSFFSHQRDDVVGSCKAFCAQIPISSRLFLLLLSTNVVDSCKENIRTGH